MQLLLLCGFWYLVLTRQKLIPFDQDGGKLINSVVRSHLTEENEHSNRVSDLRLNSKCVIFSSLSVKLFLTPT